MLPPNFIENLVKGLPKIKDKLEATFLQNAHFEIGRRVFTEGKATDGSSIGQYSPVTKKIRKSKQQQTNVVNLEDTRTLSRSVKVGESGSEKVMGIEDIMYQSENLTTVQNANKQEKHFGKTIFRLSKEEVDKAFSGAEKAIDKDIDKLINSAFK